MNGNQLGGTGSAAAGFDSTKFATRVADKGCDKGSYGKLVAGGWGHLV